MRIKILGQACFGLLLAIAVSAIHAKDQKKAEETPSCSSWVLAEFRPVGDGDHFPGALRCGQQFQCVLDYRYPPYRTREECLPFEDGIFKFCMRASCSEGA